MAVVRAAPPASHPARRLPQPRPRQFPALHLPMAVMRSVRRSSPAPILPPQEIPHHPCRTAHTAAAAAPVYRHPTVRAVPAVPPPRDPRRRCPTGRMAARQPPVCPWQAIFPWGIAGHQTRRDKPRQRPVVQVPATSPQVHPEVDKADPVPETPSRVSRAPLNTSSQN